MIVPEAFVNVRDLLHIAKANHILCREKLHEGELRVNCYLRSQRRFPAPARTEQDRRVQRIRVFGHGLLDLGDAEAAFGQYVVDER